MSTSVHVHARRGRRWADLPLRHKLTGMLAIGTGLTAVLAAAAMLWTSASFSTAQVREQAQEITRTLAFLLQGPVGAADEPGIRRTLDVLQTRPHILRVWVTEAGDRGGRVLARWGNDTGAAPAPDGGGLVEGTLTRTTPILSHAGETLGRVTVQLDLQDQRRNFQTLCTALAAVGLIVLLLSYALARALARRLARPLLELSATATAIAAGQDFGARLVSPGGDEVGQAVTAFNAMLDEIQHRGRSMVAMNEQLSRLVDDRTQEARRAEAASRAKSLFLANMSHEIRTPMNGILCMTDLALETPQSDDQREYLKLVKSSADDLMRVVNDILDYARIEADKLVISAVPFSLQALMRDSLGPLGQLARDKGLDLHHRQVSPVDTLVGDPVRLRQILFNLVDNAVKFSDRGRVDVTAACRLDEQDQCWLDLSVGDTGMGIAPDKQQLIFEAFTQADGSTTRRHGGTGLGLAICAQLVRLMGGRIRVDSTPGQGSTFVATVKVAVFAAEGPSAGEQLDDPVWPDLDRAALTARVGDDPDLIQELTALLLEDCHQRLADIRRCLDRGDAPGTAQLAHQLVGAAGNCSAVALAQLATRLVSAARAGQLDLSARLLDRLHQRLNRLSQLAAHTAQATGPAACIPAV